MTFELRTYTAAPGRLDDVLTRFRNHTVALFERHGIESLGYWTAADQPDTLIYIVRHNGDPAANWKAFVSDPEWIRVRDESHVNGEIVDNIDSVYLEATDFSAIH